MVTRPIIVAHNGLVASGHPLASQAGLRVLRDGGNAVDAAVVASAVSAVVKPFATGIGGDLFALVYVAREGRVHAVNASGPAPRSATRDLFRGRGLAAVPRLGPMSIETPGCVAGWALAADRFGTLPLGRLLGPAIEYAEQGHGASAKLVDAIAAGQHSVGDEPGWRETFLPEGRPPRIGQALRLPALARSLRAIAEGGAEEFYRGDLARRLAAGVRRAGGLLDVEDLADCRAEILEPIAGAYRDYTVYGQPPVSQGIILLLELAILDGFDLAAKGLLTPDAVHHMVEATKIGFASRLRWYGDPAWRENPTAQLLSPDFVERCREGIHPTRAAEQVTLPLLQRTGTDTTFLTTADRDGNVVAMIQSLYASWGSGVVAGDTGVLMNNRLSAFFLDPAHPNALEPGKRTIHTLNTYMLFRNGRPYLAGGTPGGDDQVQVNLQVISNIVDHGLDIQSAVETPRWSSVPGSAPWTRPHETPYAVRIEDTAPPELAVGLRERGHRVESAPAWSIGSQKLLLADPDSGALLGAADPRREAYAVGW